MYTKCLRAAGIFWRIKNPALRLSFVFESDYLTIPAATVSFVASSTRMIEPVTLLTV